MIEQEGKCDWCGNHTTVALTTQNKLICAICQGNEVGFTLVEVDETAQCEPEFADEEQIARCDALRQEILAYAEPAFGSASTSDDSTYTLIKQVCAEIADFLISKNRKYGDSAINPTRVFSTASPIEQINVRLDDKLSRLRSAQGDDQEDAEWDLLGYLILKRVAIRVHRS